MAESRNYSITTIKPKKSPLRILTDTTESVHFEGISIYKRYLAQKVRDDMINLYHAFELDHYCELCKLKT